MAESTPSVPAGSDFDNFVDDLAVAFGKEDMEDSLDAARLESPEIEIDSEAAVDAIDKQAKKIAKAIRKYLRNLSITHEGERLVGKPPI